jgi:hypothetical protein
MKIGVMGTHPERVAVSETRLDHEARVEFKSVSSMENFEETPSFFYTRAINTPLQQVEMSGLGRLGAIDPSQEVRE